MMGMLNWLLLILTILCWGISPLIEKGALKKVSPLEGIFIRCVAIFFTFFLYFLFSGKLKEVTKIPVQGIILFTISGILSGGIGMYIYFTLLRKAPVSKTIPLVSIYPLITAILGTLIFKENFSWQKLIGTILIIIGVFLVK